MFLWKYSRSLKNILLKKLRKIQNFLIYFFWSENFLSLLNNCFIDLHNIYIFFIKIFHSAQLFKKNHFSYFTFSFHNSYKNAISRLLSGVISYHMGINLWYQFRLDMCEGRFAYFIRLHPLTFCCTNFSVEHILLNFNTYMEIFGIANSKSEFKMAVQYGNQIEKSFYVL